MNNWDEFDRRIKKLRENVMKNAARMLRKYKQNGFEFKPFSEKQKKVLTWWCKASPVHDEEGIIADGAIRSGKTLCMSLSYVLWAMSTFRMQNLGMAGKTIGSFRRNVLFWLKLMLRSRGYTVVDHRSDNMVEISKGEVVNYFYIFGGKDERSQDLIQGITLAGMFFDEVALMPESFVNQATGRCSVDGSKFWFNCNPDSPSHWFKVNWIDKSTGYLGEEKCKEIKRQAAEENKPDGLKEILYLHFTMDDNLSLSEKVKARYRTMYSGVFYDRFIRGLWVTAAGLIFRYFAEDDSLYLIADEELYETVNGKPVMRTFSKLVMGIDFGGNKSKTTFGITGYLNGYHTLIFLDEDEVPATEDIDAKAICDKFIEFYSKVIYIYGRVDWVFPDSASTTMINSLRSAAREAGLPYRNIKGCRKNEVSERPKTVDLLLNTGRLKINKRCVNIRKAIASLRWDEDHPDIPEDKNIGNVNDWWDCFCYTWLDFVEYIDLKR